MIMPMLPVAGLFRMKINPDRPGSLANSHRRSHAQGEENLWQKQTEGKAAHRLGNDRRQRSHMSTGLKGRLNRVESVLKIFLFPKVAQLGKSGKILTPLDS